MRVQLPPTRLVADQRVATFVGAFVFTQFLLTGLTLVLPGPPMAAAWFIAAAIFGYGARRFEMFKARRKRMGAP